MRALEFRKSIPRFALLNLFGRRMGAHLVSRVAPLALRDLSDPKLPNEQWVRIAPRLAGICGSDVATLCASGSPYLAPVTSMPFVMGHELVGHIVDVGREVKKVSVGDRIVLRPALGCRARGIDPRCAACRGGRDALCRNVTRGVVSAGIQTGYCRDTGGAFGDNLVAHESQVYRVPDEICDPAAVLIEPFACALHGTLRLSLSADDRVLVIGCGTIGLLTIAALRAIGCPARILAVAKYEHQRRLAGQLGADVVLSGDGPLRHRYTTWAAELGAEVLDPELGKPMVIGGATATFDCVASSQTIDDGIRFTRSGGSLILMGMPGIPTGVDWTPLWFQEMTIHASYAYGSEEHNGRRLDTFDCAIDFMRSWGTRLKELVGEPYALSDHRAAMISAIYTGRSRVVKTVFAVNDRYTGYGK